MSLRPALPPDAARVAQILVGARAAFMPYAPSPHPDDDVQRWVREELLPAGGVTLACRGQEVIGVLAVRQTDEAGWIEQLMLDPAEVGHGIGQRLLAHALSLLRPPVRLYTFQANTGSRRFYERHGFVAVAFGDGSGNEERCPDVLYERGASAG